MVGLRSTQSLSLPSQLPLSILSTARATSLDLDSFLKDRWNAKLLVAWTPGKGSVLVCVEEHTGKLEQDVGRSASRSGQLSNGESSSGGLNSSFDPYQTGFPRQDHVESSEVAGTGDLKQTATEATVLHLTPPSQGLNNVQHRLLSANRLPDLIARKCCNLRQASRSAATGPAILPWPPDQH